MNDGAPSPLRALPPAHEILGREVATSLLAQLPRDAVRALVRDALDDARRALLDGALEPERAKVTARVETRLRAHATRASKPRVRRVLNATGVLLHTNLGRAPLGATVLASLSDACRGYAALEYDLEQGARGHRDRALAALCTALLGCEDALVVNNGAAAVLLACTALASGRELIVSRGELVEIGGGFRIPEVITSCGARLCEVGTTNRTRLDDYRRALGPQTAALMKVHRSNFALRGFTADVPLRALSALGRERGVPVLYDLGSGWLSPATTGRRDGDLVAGYERALHGEPGVREALEDGADLVLFSGDKLLGGPQAGLIVGRASYVRALRAHPLTRALRPGRLVVAALEAVLRSYAAGAAWRELPVLAALDEGDASVRARAERLRAAVVQRCPESAPELVRTKAAVGGGSMPERELPSWAVLLRGVAVARTASFMRALRVAAEPPLVARVLEGHVALDVRALGITGAPDDELIEAARAVANALARLHHELQMHADAGQGAARAQRVDDPRRERGDALVRTIEPDVSAYTSAESESDTESEAEDP